MHARPVLGLFAIALLGSGIIPALVSGCEASCEDKLSCGPFIANSEGAAGAASLGESCTKPDECESGYCVDSVCCETDCAEMCSACNLGGDGSCAPAPAGTDGRGECEPGVCDGIGSCALGTHSGFARTARRRIRSCQVWRSTTRATVSLVASSVARSTSEARC